MADANPGLQVIDLQFRPDSYMIPDSPLDLAVLKVRGSERRRLVREYLAAGRTDRAERLLGRPERTREQLPPWPERDCPGMCGEYLPEFLPGEIELMRIEWCGDEGQVVSVRACPKRGGWSVHVVDEIGLGYFGPRSWYKQPLTLGELVAFVDASGHDREHVGLVFGVLGTGPESVGHGVGPELLHELRGLSRVESAFYPQLARWYDEAIAAWGEPVAKPELPRPVEPAATAKPARTEARSQPERPRRTAKTSNATPAAAANPETPLVALQKHVERLLRAGDDEAARREHRELVELQEAASGRAWAGCLFGTIGEKAGRFDMAHEFYSLGRRVGGADPDVDYWLHNNDGYALNELGRHAEAEALCRWATEAQPDRYNAWKNLGLSLAGQGRVVDAARAYMRAMLACPGEPRAQSHLMDLLPEHADTIVRAVPELTTFVEGWRTWQRRRADSEQP